MGAFRRHRGSARRAVGVLLASPLLLTPAYSGASSAAAAEPGPVITSPTAGAQVGGEIEVTVASAAPYVLVAWGPEASWGGVSAVETRDGVATAVLSTSGYAGPTTIVARECQSWCNGDTPSTTVPAQTSVQVDVSNPAPQWDVEHWVPEFSSDGTLAGIEEGRWAWYGIFIDGQLQHPVMNAPWALIDVDALGDGEHTVQLAHCTEHSARVFETSLVCDAANASDTRAFIVRTRLHPVITAVRPGTISPDGNGVADSATVYVQTETPSQVVIWELRRNTQVVAHGSFLAADAGLHPFTVSGLDTGGTAPASGTYAVHVQTWVTPGTSGSDVVGETSTTLEVDLDAPTVADAATTPGVFRPAVRDHVTFTGQLGERAARLRVRLLRGDTVVRRLWLGPRPAGSFSASWDGTRRNGEPMRAGTYRYQFLTQDRVGNAAIRSGGRFELRSAR